MTPAKVNGEAMAFAPLGSGVIQGKRRAVCDLNPHGIVDVQAGQAGSIVREVERVGAVIPR